MKSRTLALALGGAALCILAGCAGGTPEEPVTVTVTETVTATPEPDPTPTPEEADAEADPAAAAAGDTFALGQPVTYAGMTLTVNSVEVLPSIPTIEGGSIDAGEGEQLVLVSTHFVNQGSGTVDLSCSGVPDAYIQAWDDQEREMAPVFDTYKIAGNPECNAQLLSGQEHDWNFAYRAIAGSSPLALTIADMRQIDGNITIDLRR
ncbi:hypothetical protein DBB34_14525 [Sphaerisporangium cinnabarinum]|nr:hypothetical protein [Sphaerisporangium cinnabarinum]PTU55369.1 hypothetical protein DBB34_14525 [Sphaerisporangium cinnabarinum]